VSVEGQEALRKPRVLVIEDVSAIRRLIEVCLRPIGPDLTMAADGPTGLQSAVDDPPEVILLDIGLPGMDGWQVLEGLRTESLTARIPVLLLTGHADQCSSADARRRGAAAFMTKPFQPEALRRQVLGLLPDASVELPTEVA